MSLDAYRTLGRSGLRVSRLCLGVTPNFPHGFLMNTRHVQQSGATVNGVVSEPWPLAPKSGAEQW
jgi:aryl-alcohol dehydrogenase-like predicted oxidoreductase